MESLSKRDCEELLRDFCDFHSFEPLSYEVSYFIIHIHNIEYFRKPNDLSLQIYVP